MKNLLFIAVVTMLLASCVSTSRNKVSGYLTYETVCLGSKSDGSQRVKGYGKASSKIEAIEMAQGCEVKPVIFDPNLLETRSDYFNSFFANGGDYAKFVSTEGEATATQEKKEAGNDVTFGVAMTINRAALKQKFIEDKLLNP
jgi:opacity protein-like surface antigen